MAYLVLFYGGEFERFENPVFVTRNETTASQFCDDATKQLEAARAIPRPTWTIDEVKAGKRDLMAEMAAWEAKRRAAIPLHPLAWDVSPGDGCGFEYQQIEERS